MILILSDKSDQHADRVESILQQNDAEYSRLNLDVDSAKSTRIRIEDNTLRIEAPNCSFSTSQIDAVWNSTTYLEHYAENNFTKDANFLIWKETWNKTLDGLFSSLESTKWLNFCQNFYTENQFSQFAISQSTGLIWPSFICSNDINYLNSFFETKKGRLLELMDQECTKGSLENCHSECLNKHCSHFPNSFSEIRCPLTSNTYHVRCSVVGKEYFAGKIRAKIDVKGQIIACSTTDDTDMHPPKDIKIRANKIMTELSLTHGIFDFMVTEDGEWFFEALNPTGQYQWIEDIKGKDISSSIAKWLMMNN